MDDEQWEEWYDNQCTTLWEFVLGIIVACVGIGMGVGASTVLALPVIAAGVAVCVHAYIGAGRYGDGPSSLAGGDGGWR